VLEWLTYPQPARRRCFSAGSTLLLVGASLWGADLFPEETAFRATFNTSPVNLVGRVVESSGAPVAGCTLRLDSGESIVTAPDGKFALAGLARSNQLLTATAPGYYRHLLPVHLFVPLTQTNVALPPIVLWPDTPSVVRFLFGGDTAFARRMLDPLERAARDQMPIENPEALIPVSDPLPGTLDVVNFIKPLFHAADYPIVNFESVVTLDPSTPHWQKAFVYFTLPASLPALKSLNVDYVSLGNNHTYDYLESGVSNTRRYFDEAGIHYSGLGSNSAAALAPYRTSIKGTPYSFLAMTSIGGEQHATNYVAGPDKGGAAYIEATAEARQAIGAERGAGFATILQTHIGDEYTFEPSNFALKWMKFGVDAGADLVVAHHTHVAQGFGMHRGVLLVHSLGNLFFDQDRLETMVGLVATIDMEGRSLRKAWGTPVYLEDYRPRFMSGEATPVLLRRMAEFSQQLRVYPYNGQAWLAHNPSQYSFQDRRIVLPVIVGTNGWTVVDLRDFAAPEESLARVEADAAGLIIRPGRDLMSFGDFEDVDVDQERGEASRWDFNTNTTVALKNPYRGTAALCMYRKSTYIADGVAAFRNRVRVMGDAYNTPNKDLSLFGYVRAQQAGRIAIVSRYYASEGTMEFGEEVAFNDPGGTFGWKPFMQDLHMPPDDPMQAGDPPAVNARAVRIFLRHSPTVSGVGYVWFDEIAIINWEEVLDSLPGAVLDAPHARDFLRVQGPAGTYRVALTFRSYRPIEVDAGHGPDLALETERPDQSVNRPWFKPTAVGFEDALRLVLWNRGNQPLVAGDLVFTNGNQTDFSARWLAMNGSPEAGPVLAVPPKACALLEVRFRPTAAGSRQAVLQFQSNDPDEGQSLVNLVVGGDAYTNTPVRFISGNRTLSPTIHIQVPSPTTSTNVLWEQLPFGVTPVDISAGGHWDVASRTLQWQDVGGQTTVSYSLMGTGNVGSISGWIASGGRFDATAGDGVAIVFAPEDADSDGLPDWWEQKFFDSRASALPEMDSDGDGQTNLAEFLAGTHPLSNGFQAQQWAPYLRLSMDDRFANLRVFGFEGASYRIENSTDLQNWFSISTNVLSGQSVVMPRMNLPGVNSLFYRAAVEER
jgi:poly-gamma-glutamate capsule biosynthesis protein CapA/YwtB (metallophosphatase superfamily)